MSEGALKPEKKKKCNVEAMLAALKTLSRDAEMLEAIAPEMRVPSSAYYMAIMKDIRQATVELVIAQGGEGQGALEFLDDLFQKLLDAFPKEQLAQWETTAAESVEKLRLAGERYFGILNETAGEINGALSRICEKMKKGAQASDEKTGALKNKC